MNGKTRSTNFIARNPGLIFGPLGLSVMILVGGLWLGCSDDTPPQQPVPDAGTTEPVVDDCGYALVSVPEDCDACHGAPPEIPTHPPNHRCFRCHGAVIDDNYEFIQPDLHMDGEVQKAVGCSSCHGWNQGMSPPQNLSGECGDELRGVGAHWPMRHAETPIHRVNCSNCHTVPTSTWADGHIDGDNVVELTFNHLATLDDATPSYDPQTNVCSGIYCHGATLSGGTHTEPNWLDTSGTASQCGACHRLTDPDGNTDADCNSCHPSSVDTDGNILPRGQHLNGQIDMD